MPKKLIIVVLVALWLGGCATHAITSGRFVVRDDHARVEIAITPHDRTLIQDYYREHTRSRTQKKIGRAS